MRRRAGRSGGCCGLPAPTSTSLPCYIFTLCLRVPSATPAGIDPDDAFSSVPYEKGFYLLYYLQTVVGKEPFEAFLHDYIQTFKYKSITAQDFKGYFCAYFTEGRHTLPRVSHSGIPPSHTGAAGPTDRHDSADIPSLAVPNDGELGVPAVHGVDEAAVAAAKAHAIDVSSVDWDTWFYAPGQPPVTNQYDASERGAVDAHADAWVADAVSAAATAKDVTHEWHTHHRIAFLERLVSKSDELAAASPAATFSPMLLKGIDSAFSFSGSRNSEIRLLWSKLAIRSGMVEILPSVIDFLKSQGRMKYTRPLFRELLKSSFGRAPALELYAAHKGAYHPICAKVRRVSVSSPARGVVWCVCSSCLSSLLLTMSGTARVSVAYPSSADGGSGHSAGDRQASSGRGGTGAGRGQQGEEGGDVIGRRASVRLNEGWIVPLRRCGWLALNRSCLAALAAAAAAAGCGVTVPERHPR